jgi:hypothetical protein
MHESFLAVQNDVTERGRKSGNVISEEIPYAGTAERMTKNSIAEV